MSLFKVVMSTHKTNTDMHIFLNFIFKRAYNINGSNISSEIVHLLKKLPEMTSCFFGFQNFLGGGPPAPLQD